MKIENDLTRLVEIKYSIIQGTIGLPETGTSQLAVPVSEPGDPGMLTTSKVKQRILNQKSTDGVTFK